MRILSPSLAAALLLASIAPKADGVRPSRYGPFLQQNFTAEASPAGWHALPPSGSYGFQAGWMEPIGFLPKVFFRGAYLEARGNAALSPYTSDIGTAFNLKPIRFLEIGLGYNRLLYHNSLVGFNAPDSAPIGWLPSTAQWRSEEILQTGDRELAGADLFTYQGNITVDLARLQLHAGGFRNLWDVDVQDRQFVFEYGSGLLIKKRDRVNSLFAQAFLNLHPYLDAWGLSMRGLEVREQFWWTSQTHLEQNLVSAGFVGLRWGQNDSRLYRGLDVLVGFWTRHEQLRGKSVWQRCTISLEWMWNVQILRLGEE